MNLKGTDKETVEEWNSERGVVPGNNLEQAEFEGSALRVARRARHGALLYTYAAI